ncbi:MAG: tRNA(Met) cytidine acetyltransferase [Pseudomonadales bacterium]|nr:tRNA(Met) cytidine acetyltransferase [Pseudomonadales bacterium]
MTRPPDFSELTLLAQAKHQRLVVHIEGHESEALEQAYSVAQKIIAHQPQSLSHFSICDEQVFAASALVKLNNMACLNSSQAVNKMRHLLGRDAGLLIINAYSGFNANVLGISSGCISAGAALILITPEISQWPNLKDSDAPYQQDRSRYLQRCADILSSHQCVIHARVFAQGVTWSETRPLLKQLSTLADKNSYLELAYSNQKNVVAAISHVMTGHAKRPLIIEADRGRGKSAAMGIAVAGLLFNAVEPVEIVITAPQKAAVETFFLHVEQELQRLQSDAGMEHGSFAFDVKDSAQHSITYQQSQVYFLVIDQLILQRPKLSLLLIDEAAAIPVAQLKQLLNRYTRLVFATTVFGYEGNGRGFSLRFLPFLAKKMPQYKNASLALPMRWSEGDVLEKVINDLLLLDVERDLQLSVAKTDVNLKDAVFSVFSQQQLLQQPPLLTSIFSLLVAAHYQTSGDDLRVLLDHPDIHIACLSLGGEIVAVVLLMIEGGFSAEDQNILKTQARRFRGHLLAQQCFHAGFDVALKYRYARVMRIAVDASFQGAGLGGKLLHQLGSYIGEKNLADFYGASFAAETLVLRFWQANDFQLCQLGSRKDSSSGLYTVAVMQCLSTDVEAQEFYLALIRQWHADLPYRLLTQVNDIQPELLPALFASYKADVDQRDLHNVAEYCAQRRGYEVIQPSIYRLVQGFLGHGDVADWIAAQDHDKILLLLDAVLLNKPWQALTHHYKYNGRKAIEAQFRAVLLSLLTCLQHK